MRFLEGGKGSRRTSQSFWLVPRGIKLLPVAAFVGLGSTRKYEEPPRVGKVVMERESTLLAGDI